MPRDANDRTPPGRAMNRRRTGVAALLVASALSLSGCDTLMLMTGQRTRLPDGPLQSITATLPGTGRLAPGASARLSVVATTADGQVLATAGTGAGKVLADSYRYEASIVAVSAKGVVSLPADPRLSEGRTPHVRITAAGRVAPVADLDIPIRYDVAFAATYAGRDGDDGLGGQDGLAGNSGSMGSMDPANPGAGGDGGNGGDGSNGWPGDDGRPGPDVVVAIALGPGEHPLLRVRATEAGHDHFFLVDPQGGSLGITARGGRGGDGGRGGRGGAAGQGGSGSPSGSPGVAGQDGMAGPPGNPGAAGHVQVTIDPAAAPLLDHFHFSNESGSGRAGPAPVVTTAPVTSPW